jgi:hypothetical protein
MIMKRSVHIYIAILALSGSLVLPAVLAAAESSRGGTFLPMGWSARGAGIAGAATTLVRDDRSAYWNPANLSFLTQPRFTVGSTRLVSGLDNYYNVISVGSGVFDYKTDPGDDIQVRQMGFALTITNLWLKLAQGSRWNESAIGLSASYAINNYNSIGMTFRLLTSWTDLEDGNSMGYALDFGWTAIAYRNLWFGIVARDIVSSIGYENRTDRLDPTLNIALAYENIFDRASVECDLVMRAATPSRFLIGTEIDVVRNFMVLLAGADIRLIEGQRTIPTAGVLFNYKDFEVGLGFIFDPLDAFGRQTRISVGYAF